MEGKTNRYLIIKTRDELLRIRISDIMYLEADRNYTKLMLSEGVQFTFAINIGRIEEMLENQVFDYQSVLLRVGKSFIINKNYILQINLPKQKLLLLPPGGKPRELIVSKEPLKGLKEKLEQEGIRQSAILKETLAREAAEREVLVGEVEDLSEKTQEVQESQEPQEEQKPQETEELSNQETPKESE